jgi:hypothetical protein
MIASFAIIAFAALIHASFQLSVSMLTLLSGHAIGRRTAHHKLLQFACSFITGIAFMVLLLVSFGALVLQRTLPHGIPILVWAIAAGLLIGLGVAVWVFYYRHEKGTGLWLPRGIARYLADRTKATKSNAEAFGLGLSSSVGELIFTLAPMFIAALVLIQLEPAWQLIGIALYTLISLGSLLIVYVLIGGGHKLSQIQKWRERNKRFLQFAAGAGLLVLGFYIYVEKVIAIIVAGGN